MISLIVVAMLMQKKPTMLVNQGFEKGLLGWNVEGSVSVEHSPAIAGSNSVRLGPGKAAIWQRYDVPGLRVLWLGATMEGATSLLRIQCLDKRGHLLLSQTSQPKNGKPASIYLRTHAFTDHVIVRLESSGNESTLADDVLLTDDDKGRVEHRPTLDLVEAMRPIWSGSTVSNESVLLLGSANSKPEGSLMFPIRRVISVRDATLQRTYRAGQDFEIRGSKLIALPNSNIPTMNESEFATGKLPWTRLDGRHIFVTYEHSGRWTGPTPSYQGKLLPNFAKKLIKRKPMTVVAFGDSITQGVNVSGFRNVPPYLPDWPTLATIELRRRTGNPEIKLFNVSLGGQTSKWAKDNAKDVVASLDPDLVIIAFGMNDFWTISPEAFIDNLREVMSIIRSRRPECEFVLVSSMNFDPAYSDDPTYISNMKGYAKLLADEAKSGVALLDMDAISRALYKLKRPKDLATDPMHPDDFLSRWYAQALVATIQPK